MMTISKKITICHDYVGMAEQSSLQGHYSESNLFWKKAVGIANTLLENNDHGSFLDEEYKFLVQIKKHFKDIDDAPEYY